MILHFLHSCCSLVCFFSLHGIKGWITFCAVIALYWSFRSLLRNYLFNRCMNSAGMDFRFKLVFCAFFNLATVTSKPGVTNFPVSAIWCVFNSYIIVLPFYIKLLGRFGSSTFLGTSCSLPMQYIAACFRKVFSSFEGGTLKWMNWNLMDLREGLKKHVFLSTFCG